MVVFPYSVRYPDNKFQEAPEGRCPRQSAYEAKEAKLRLGSFHPGLVVHPCCGPSTEAKKNRAGFTLPG
jgi:hypothetical protein